jgi:putative Mg2+ transporter-C (MgtC) family protein
MLVFTPEDLIKILVAVLIGGVIGFERELHSKAAGLRTITLITVGAAMFTILSIKFTDPATARVASNIVTGVGFLGAGAILFAEGKVKGLTTASSIWVAAALGMAVGLGQYILGLTTALLVVIVLDLFTRLTAGWTSKAVNHVPTRSSIPTGRARTRNSKTYSRITG